MYVYIYMNMYIHIIYIFTHLFIYLFICACVRSEGFVTRTLLKPLSSRRFGRGRAMDYGDVYFEIRRSG